MNLEVLLRLHPSWPDVRQIDELLARDAGGSRAFPPPSAAPEAGMALPAPLDMPADSGSALPASEQQHIERARTRAYERVSNLQNTLQVAQDRVIADERATAERLSREKAASLEADLRKQENDKRIQIEKKYRLLILNAQLKEIAFKSQVEALYPSDLRSTAEKELAKARIELRNLQTERATALDAPARERKEALVRSADLAQAELKQRDNESAQKHQRELAGAVAANKQIVDLVFATLGPLEPPAIHWPTEIMSAARGAGQQDSPDRVFVASQGGRVPANGEPSSAARLSPPMTGSAEARTTRDRLSRFMHDDVVRRLNRIADERHWQVTTDPRRASALPDRTAQVAELLREEWKP